MTTTWHRAISQTAAEYLVEQVAKAPGEVTVLALGPLANIGRALELDPAFATNVREIVVMGGAYMVSGNVSPIPVPITSMPGRTER